MALEDFTDLHWVEVDPNNHITKTAHHSNHEVHSDEDAHLYDDKGVDHFGNFEHKFKTRATTLDRFNLIHPWAVSKDVGDAADWYAADKDALLIVWNGSAGGPQIFLFEYFGFSARRDDGSVILNLNTWYFITVKKDGTALTAEIYSTELLQIAGGPGDVDSLSVTLGEDYNFRYVFVANTYQTDNPNHTGGVGDSDNLDLQEAVGVSIPVAMHHYGHHINKIIRG